MSHNNELGSVCQFHHSGLWILRKESKLKMTSEYIRLSLNLSLCYYSPAIRPETLTEEPIKQRLADMLILNRGLIGTLPRELHSLPQSPRSEEHTSELQSR